MYYYFDYSKKEELAILDELTKAIQEPNSNVSSSYSLEIHTNVQWLKYIITFLKKYPYFDEKIKTYSELHQKSAISHAEKLAALVNGKWITKKGSFLLLFDTVTHTLGLYFLTYTNQFLHYTYGTNLDITTTHHPIKILIRETVPFLSYQSIQQIQKSNVLKKASDKH